MEPDPIPTRNASAPASIKFFACAAVTTFPGRILLRVLNVILMLMSIMGQGLYLKRFGIGKGVRQGGFVGVLARGFGKGFHCKELGKRT